jgi:hypothetical protein
VVQKQHACLGNPGCDQHALLNYYCKLTAKNAMPYNLRTFFLSITAWCIQIRIEGDKDIEDDY